jgi:hypothetical protein
MGDAMIDRDRLEVFRASSRVSSRQAELGESSLPWSHVPADQVRPRKWKDIASTVVTVAKMTLLSRAAERHSEEEIVAASETIQNAVHALIDCYDRGDARSRTARYVTFQQRRQQNAAATQIQAVQRGMNTRNTRRRVCQDKEQNAAAAKIQAVQRGKNVRRSTEDRKRHEPTVVLAVQAQLTTELRLKPEAAQMHNDVGRRSFLFPCAMNQQFQAQRSMTPSSSSLFLGHGMASSIVGHGMDNSGRSMTMTPTRHMTRHISLKITKPASTPRTISASRMLSLTHVLMLLDSQEEVPPPKFCLPENRVASSVAASTVVSASGGPVSLEDPMDTGKCPKCKCPGHFHFIMGLDTACTHLARSLIGSRTLKDALASGSQGYVKKHHALSKCGPSRPLMPEEANDILEGWGADMREQQDWAAAAVYEANGLADFAVV